MTDIVKKIFEYENEDDAIAYLTNLYDTMCSSIQDVEINANTHSQGTITYHKGMFSRNSIINYSDGVISRYRADFRDSIPFLVNYIRTKKIQDKYSFFKLITNFNISYLGITAKKDIRDDFLSSKIPDDATDDELFKIINNFSIEDFKGKNIGMCTEFTIITNIVSSLFGIECYYVTGNYSIGEMQDAHAYNILHLADGYYILDTSNPHCLYNSSGRLVNCINTMKKISDEDFESLLNGDITIEVPIFNYIYNDNLQKWDKTDEKTGIYSCYKKKIKK